MTLNHPAPRLEQVNINELMEKVSSKRDVYNFLTQECEAYLPKLDTVNIFFLKQITRGTKDVRFHQHYLLVYKAISSESVSNALDRWPDDRRLPDTHQEEANSAQASARWKGLEPPRQEVGVRHTVQLGSSSYPGHDH